MNFKIKINSLNQKLNDNEEFKERLEKQKKEMENIERDFIKKSEEIKKKYSEEINHKWKKKSIIKWKKN